MKTDLDSVPWAALLDWSFLCRLPGPYMSSAAVGFPLCSTLHWPWRFSSWRASAPVAMEIWRNLPAAALCPCDWWTTDSATSRHTRKETFKMMSHGKNPFLPWLMKKPFPNPFEWKQVEELTLTCRTFSSASSLFLSSTSWLYFSWSSSNLDSVRENKNDIKRKKFSQFGATLVMWLSNFHPNDA